MVDAQLPSLTRRLAAISLFEDEDVVMSEPRQMGVPDIPLQPRQSRATSIRKRAKRKKSLAQTIAFTKNFIRNNAEELFGRVLEPALASWISLLGQTTLPIAAPITFQDITNAINSLENAIAFKEDTELLARLGHFRLSIFFDLLEERIQQDRRSGLIPSKSGRGNASIALDYYLHALNVGSDPIQRGLLRERKRRGGRWRELAGPSVFLLLVYSDTAERFVYVSAGLLSQTQVNTIIGRTTLG